MSPLFRGDIDALQELLNTTPPVALAASVFSREASDPSSALMHLAPAQVLSWKYLEPKHSSGPHLIILQLYSIALPTSAWLRFERSAEPSTSPLHPSNPSSHTLTLSSNPNQLRPPSDQYKHSADITLERFTLRHFLDLLHIVLDAQPHWNRDPTHSPKWFISTMTNVVQNLGTAWTSHPGSNGNGKPDGFRQKLAALFDKDYVSPASQQLFILRQFLQSTRGDQLIETVSENDQLLTLSGSGSPSDSSRYLLLSPSESVPSYDPNSSLSQRYVRASHDFVGPDTGDLAFSTGDLIELLDFGDGNWWKGRLRDTIGDFPRNYVERVSSLRLQAMNDFNPLHPSWNTRSQLVVDMETGQLPQAYLSFRKGDVIDFLGTTHDTTTSGNEFFTQEEWYVGKLEDSVGLLPRSCVEVIRSPLDDDKHSRRSSSTKFKVYSPPTSPSSALSWPPPPYPPSPSPPSPGTPFKSGTV